jgi:hypothetical protein
MPLDPLGFQSHPPLRFLAHPERVNGAAAGDAQRAADITVAKMNIR